MGEWRVTKEQSGGGGAGGRGGGQLVINILVVLACSSPATNFGYNSNPIIRTQPHTATVLPAPPTQFSSVDWTEIRGGRPRLRRCAEFRSRMTSDSRSDDMARAKEKQLTWSTPAAATTIVSDLALLCAAGLSCNCSCQDAHDGSPCCSYVAVSRGVGRNLLRGFPVGSNWQVGCGQIYPIYLVQVKGNCP